MADWNDPTVNSEYTDVLSELKARDLDVAKGLDPANVTVTNPATNMIRWNSANKYWERYNGSAWVALESTYAIAISGNAATATKWATGRTVSLTGDVTGTSGSLDGSGNVSITTTLATVTAAKGGTGQTSYTTGDILYASSSSALSKLAGVATGNALISGGVAAAPSWGKIGLTTHVTGTLPVANGGTGATSAANARTNLGASGGVWPISVGGTGASTAEGARAALDVPSNSEAILDTIIDAKGDLIVGTAADTVARKAAGPDNTLLGYDSSQSDGLRAFAAGGNVSISSGAINAIVADVRQTQLAGPVDSSGYNATLSAGTGLNFNVNATPTNAVLSFADGFGASGAKDLITVLSANASNQGSLAASNTNYIHATYSSATSVTWGSTLVPPQYGYAFDRTTLSILQFDGTAGSTTFLDDGGMTWTAVGGAKVQSTQVKFGTGALGGGGAANALNGTTDGIKTADFKSFGGGSWTMRCWVYPTANPGTGAFWPILSGNNGTAAAAQFGIVNNGGVVRWNYYLSSSGTSHDIASNVVGTSAPVLNAWTFLELTYDALAGVYRFYVNGTQEASTTSTLRVCATTQLEFGRSTPSGVGFQGYIDKPEVRVGVCDHPAGTAYSVPTQAPSITDHKIHFFSIPEMKMYEVTAASASAGTNPTMTQRMRLFVGEQDTNGSAVTATRNYALRGTYESDWIPVTGTLTAYSRNHNIGVMPRVQRLVAAMRATVGFFGPGSETTPGDPEINNTGSDMGTAISSKDRNTGVASVARGIYIQAMAGGFNSVTVTNVLLKMFFERGW